MPSTPITPHLFPRLVITPSFPAHLPLPPDPEWHTGKGNEGCDQYRTASSCCSFLLTLFPCFSMGLPQALQSFMKYHMLQSGLHGLLGHHLLHCGLSARCPKHLLPFSHLSVAGLVLTLFPSLLTAVQYFVLSQVSFPRGAVAVPEGFRCALWMVGCSCLELAVSIPGQPWLPLMESTPAPSHGQCLGNDTQRSNLSKRRG